MDGFVIRPFGKRVVLALLLVAALAFQFWTQSRYPSLNEKAMMSGAMQLEDSLSFEALIPVLPEYPLWKQIGISTLNWIKSNERGMIFGVLLGAAFLTLLGYLRGISFRNGFANSALGMAMGAPLGVCVNCAAPIAKGNVQRRRARGIDIVRHGGLADAQRRRAHHAVQHAAVLHGGRQDRAQPVRHLARGADPVPLPARQRIAARGRRPHPVQPARSGRAARARRAGAGGVPLHHRLREEPLVHRLDHGATDAARRLSRLGRRGAVAERPAAQHAARLRGAVHDVAGRHVPPGSDRLRRCGRRRAAQWRACARLRHGAGVHARHLQRLFVLHRRRRDLAARGAA